MLLTNKLHSSPIGGRELLCKLNHDILKEILNEKFTLFELATDRSKGIRASFSYFKGHIDGLTDETMAAALKVIVSANIQKVFVDGSNLGGFTKYIKKKIPQLEVITFFHNIEVRFFWGSFRQNKSLHTLAVLVANYLAEGKSAKYSDKIICLSRRDSELLEKTYGRSATYISPMVLEDKLSGDVNKVEAPHESFVLFVGGDFYANRQGIQWFVKNVVPRIGIKICIVGHGFEKFRMELEIEGKVEVIGSVESLQDWYLKSLFVIAPIFDGSGMKTKVAEALMFGKKIIATPEAFSGYEEPAEELGWVCSNVNEFVEAISVAQNQIVNIFDQKLRNVYECKYSYKVAKERFSKILIS